MNVPLDEWETFCAAQVVPAAAEYRSQLTEEDPESEPFRSKYAAAEAQHRLLERCDALEPQAAALELRVDGRTIPYHTIRGRIHLRHGLALAETDLAAKSRESLEQAVTCLEQAGPDGRDVVGLFAALNTLGMLLNNSDECDAALPRLEAASEVYSAVKMGAASTACSQALSQIEREEGDAAAALEEAHTRTLYFLAQVHQNLGHSDEAAQFCAATLQRQAATLGALRADGDCALLLATRHAALQRRCASMRVSGWQVRAALCRCHTGCPAQVRRDRAGACRHGRAGWRLQHRGVGHERCEPCRRLCQPPPLCVRRAALARRLCGAAYWRGAPLVLARLGRSGSAPRHAPNRIRVGRRPVLMCDVQVSRRGIHAGRSCEWPRRRGAAIVGGVVGAVLPDTSRLVHRLDGGRAPERPACRAPGPPALPHPRPTRRGLPALGTRGVRARFRPSSRALQCGCAPAADGAQVLSAGRLGFGPRADTLRHLQSIRVRCSPPGCSAATLAPGRLAHGSGRARVGGLAVQKAC